MVISKETRASKASPPSPLMKSWTFGHAIKGQLTWNFNLVLFVRHVRHMYNVATLLVDQLQSGKVLYIREIKKQN